MTKLLKVRWEVLTSETYYLDFDHDKNGFFNLFDIKILDRQCASKVVIRYYTSESDADAFEHADKNTFIKKFGDDFYYERVFFLREWVEVDETTIPKWKINTSVFYYED